MQAEKAALLEELEVSHIRLQTAAAAAKAAKAEAQAKAADVDELERLLHHTKYESHPDERHCVCSLTEVPHSSQCTLQMKHC